MADEEATRESEVPSTSPSQQLDEWPTPPSAGSFIAEDCTTASTPLEPHDGSIYETINFRRVDEDQWSYDVVTSVEIYRISTIRDHFIGLCDEWPPCVETARLTYKNTSVNLTIPAELDLTRALRKSAHHEEKYDAYQKMYDVALQEARERLHFFDQYPSAFAKDTKAMGEGTPNHWKAIARLFMTAENCRRNAKKQFEIAFPDRDMETEARWLLDIESTDHDKHVVPIYAISPDQYVRLREKSLTWNAQRRRKMEDPSDWESHNQRWPEVHYPLLPALRTDVRLPTYSEDEKKKYELPEEYMSKIKLGYKTVGANLWI